MEILSFDTTNRHMKSGTSKMAVPIERVTSTDSPTSIHVRGTLGSFSPTNANQQNKIQGRPQRLPVPSVSPGKRQNIEATSHA